jgi:cation diffusion facilitator family transporter
MSGDAGARKVTAAATSVISNLLLTAAKLIAAALSGSISVLSEAVHSLGDIIASGIALVSVRVSDKPADERHPFGHGKAESLAGLVESLLLAGAAAYVGYEAVQRFSEPEPIETGIAFWVVLGTAAVNVLVGRYLRKVARETDSDALRANAAHVTADVITSLGVLAALGIVWATGWTAADPIVALILTAWILYTSVQICIKSVHILLDARLPDSEVALIESVLRTHPAVRGYHQLRTRKAGSGRHVDAHILLDDDLSLIAAHEITEEVEDQIRAALPNVAISLHMEPHRRELEHRAEMHTDRM